MQISSNWAELLLPGLRKIYDKQMDKKKDYIPVLFNVDTSNSAQEFTLGVGAMGLMQEWNSAGGQVYYEDYAKGYKTTYTHKKYGLGLQIEKELLEDDKYSEIKKRVRALADSVWNTRQYYAADYFNNAFNATYAGADTYALCSASHTKSPTDTTTWSNYSTAYELDADNVETVRNAMLAWTDDKGNYLQIDTDNLALLVPPGLRKAALVIADSGGEPDTADNNVNIWKGAIKVIEWTRLTDSNAWFMIDLTRAKKLLNWFDRKKAAIEGPDVDFDTEAAKYKVTSRFSFGHDDPSFIYGCNPS